MTGEYVIPSILGAGGSSSWAADRRPVPAAPNWPFGSALSMALMAVLSAFVVVYILFATREEQFGA